jgi:hypothetical protein
MALMLTRDNVLARFGSHRGGATSLIRSASAALRHELHPAMRTGAVTLSAFTFGVIQGKYQKQGGLVLGGLPVDLLSGATLHVVALFGFARDYSSLLHALGDGALATFLATTGYRVGERWGSGTKFLSAVSGAFVGEDDKPVSGGSSVADEELRRLARG